MFEMTVAHVESYVHLCPTYVLDHCHNSKERFLTVMVAVFDFSRAGRTHAGMHIAGGFPFCVFSARERSTSSLFPKGKAFMWDSLFAIAFLHGSCCATFRCRRHLHVQLMQKEGPDFVWSCR